MTSNAPDGPPPPYHAAAGDSSFPPPAYPAQYEAPKTSQGYPSGNTQYYQWSAYNQPGYPGGGYSQPYGTQSGHYNHNTTVVVAQPAVTVIQTFRESPVHTNCPHCRAEVVTGIHFETGTFTWVICCVLWLVGCGLGCCLIPFCVDGCKDVIHTCPNCRQQIARYSRM